MNYGIVFSCSLVQCQNIKMMLKLALILAMFLMARTKFHKLDNASLNQRSRSYQNSSQGAIYQMLHVLDIEKTKPSRSLCLENNMTSCGNTCCHKQRELHYLRQFFMPQRHLQQVCEATGREVCGSACCQSHLCDRDHRTNNQKIEKLDFNLRFVSDVCHENPQQVREQQCTKTGLLWCDGQCCGFSSEKHKCFRANHYGTPFIRCPIEDPDKPQL